MTLFSLRMHRLWQYVMAVCSVRPSQNQNQSAPTLEDLLVLFLPLTPGNSNHQGSTPSPEDHLAPLPFTPGILVLLSLPRHRRPVLVGGCCYLVVSASFHVAIVDPDYHRLRIILTRLVVRSVGFPWTINSVHSFMWLDSHGLFALFNSSGPSGYCSPTPRLIHVVPVAFSTTTDSCNSFFFTET
jgi:hypothetical protein